MERDAQGACREAAAKRRREELDELLSSTFNSILRVEERALQNRHAAGLTITEMHTIVAVGLYEENPMNVIAARLDVTLATLTTAIGKLVEKGFVRRTRSSEDRRKVLVSLTTEGRKAFRSHRLFHQAMVESALEGLTEEEERVFARALVQVKRFFDEQAAMQADSCADVPDERGTSTCAIRGAGCKTLDVPVPHVNS